MRRSIVVIAILLAGCGSEYVVRSSSGGPIAAPGGGTSITTGPTGLYVSIGIGAAAAEALAWMTGVAIYGAMLMDERGQGSLLPPPMREDRTIVEVDCTRPLPPDVRGNIRCK